MTDRPIIFSAPMIRALLDGRKTQTRRIIKPRPFNRQGDVVDIGIAQRASYVRGADGRMYFSWEHPKGGPLTAYVAHYAPGDRLWVREAWLDPQMDGGRLLYTADDPENVFPIHRKRPSIHMPRSASRLTLTVTDVRVQRLQEISREDAIAEGCENPLIGTEAPSPGPGVWLADERTSFAQLWNRLHGPGAWDANPWVFALTFTVKRRNIDAAAP